MEKICVAVRVRPAVTLPEDTNNGNGTFWKIEDNRISLHRSHGTPIAGLSYAFDHVFDEKCSNSRVYELLTKDIIHAVVDGFNGTAFAYGQTSSGKTFTMNGSTTDPGIIHRAVKDIFNRINSIADREFLIRVSYMEIYNEDINDLLVVENHKLPVHENLERGIFVAGLTEEIVNNAEQVLKLLESGEVNRHFGETNMNARSSRSHTIFRMVIESKRKNTNSSDGYSIADAIRVSVLNLVDLAGSERIAKTGADGVRLKEGKHINKSLMVLGNVINKLSDGAKQRGHIPYRDSKLTRILQPALGGNAKTSIICTLAPEEVHVEETKGTLQFASRAKRITNCAQVNEILSDAALLKRQKLEIEELRKKLEGSRAEVLEQEILKLRNEMLKYELDREKLETELEEERKSQKEREQCIREQQMRIDNLSNLVPFPDCDRNSGQNSGSHSLNEEFTDSNSFFHGEAFRSPCFKAAPNSFVGSRSNYSRLPDSSPLPDSFSNVADEDTWLKMNKGYIADLDSIQMTPARKVQSFPSSDVTPGFESEKYKEEFQKLKRQLDIMMEEKNELQNKYSEQLQLNDSLLGEISQLKQEVLFIRKIPQKLHVSVSSCRGIYRDIMSTVQSSVPDEASLTAKLLSCITEIGSTVFSNLETHVSEAMDSEASFCWNSSVVQEECNVLSQRLKSVIPSLVSSETSTLKYQETSNSVSKGCCPGVTASSRKKQSSELDNMKEKCPGMMKELDLNNQFLEVSRESYSTLERDFQLLKAERDSLVQTLFESSQKLALVTSQKENILKDLNSEAQVRKHIGEEIKQISSVLANRQKLSMSIYSEIRSKIEDFKGQSTVSVSKTLGC